MKKNGIKNGVKNGVQHRLPEIRDESLRPRFDSAAIIGGDIDVKQLLTSLTGLKKGDFSVRLPLDWNGTAGKIADAFNDVVERNERMAQGTGAHQPRRRQRGKDQPARLHRRSQRLLGGFGRFGQHAHQRPGASDQRNRARDRRRGQGRSVPDHGPGNRRPSAGG